MIDAANDRRLAGRLRVLQCITRLGLGGAERVAFSLMRALRDEIDFGLFTVHGASPDAVGAALRRELEETATPGFRGTALPMKAGGMLPGGWALARAVRRFRPDIIHYHSETPEACGAVMTCLSRAAAAVPAVRTIHNSVFWRYWPRTGAWCDRRLARAAIACVSKAARTEFLRYRSESGAPPPPAEPTVIYNGVALDAREPRLVPREEGVRRVLFAGRFEEQKGVDVLCRTLPAVRLPPATRGELTLVGHGAQHTLVEALARGAPAGWTINVRGPVGDLPALFPDFDLLVMPSRFEGLGLVAIEATLCGLPVVATRAPGLREALPPDHPWLAEPGDPVTLAECLGTALAAPSGWPAVVRRAQAFALARFSPAAMGAAYRRLYAQAAGRGLAR